MPSRQEEVLWRRHNPDVALFCRSEASQGWLFNGQRWLSEENTIVARLVIAGRRASEPAEMFEALEAPNGDWRVTNTVTGVIFKYRVWLVQSGALRGERIVKVKDPGSGVYRGFAFINRDGSLSLWSRFRRDAIAAYVTTFDQALAAITNCEVGTSLCRFGYQFATSRLIITIEHRCAICNMLVLVNDPQGENSENGVTVGLCPTHAQERDAVPQVREVDPELERLLAEEEEIERRYPQPLTPGGNFLPVEPVQRTTGRIRGTISGANNCNSDGPLLSENGSGEIR